MNVKKYFGLFLVFSLVIFSLVPLLRNSLPMDTQEAIVWGKYCLWGTTKHPPFSGWIAYYFYEILGQSDISMYLLSQIFVMLGVFHIYKLGCCFLDETKACLAALLQFGVIYYNFSSVEFNVNVVSLALWPMCAYYFWLGYTQNKGKDWLLFAVFASLNLLNKYVGGLLLLAIGIFILVSKNRFRTLKNYKIYVAALVGVLILAPHVWWLYENNFETFKYIASRNKGSNVMASQWRHLLYPLKFVTAQLLFAAVALLTYGIFYWKSEKEKEPKIDDKALFLVICGCLPIDVFVLISFIQGTPLKSMWGFPCLFLLGIMLFYFLPIKLTEKTVKKFIYTMLVWEILFVVAYGTQCLLTKSERFRTDVNGFAKQMEEKWAEYSNGKPLEYVGASEWYANMMSLYAKGNVKPMVWMKPENNPWFDRKDFEAKGALVVANDKGKFESYRQMFEGRITEPQQMKIELKNYFGKSKFIDIYYGFYKGEELENAK